MCYYKYLTCKSHFCSQALQKGEACCCETTVFVFVVSLLWMVHSPPPFLPYSSPTVWPQQEQRLPSRRTILRTFLSCSGSLELWALRAPQELNHKHKQYRRNTQSTFALFVFDRYDQVTFRCCQLIWLWGSLWKWGGGWWGAAWEYIQKQLWGKHLQRWS